MKLKPLGDKLVVRRHAEAAKVGSLYVPDAAKEKPAQGEVLAVGPGKPQGSTIHVTPLGVKVGDVVLFGKYAGTEIKLDGEEFLLLSESDVLGVVEA